MTWIDSARRIVEKQTFEVLHPVTGEPVETEWRYDGSEGYYEPTEELVATDGEGILLDLFSASAMVQIHDALNPVNREKFASMPLFKAHGVAMKLLAKRSATTS